MFVDGSNLFGGICDLLKPGEYFDFGHFLTLIEKEMSIYKVKFYASYVKESPLESSSKRFFRETQKIFFDSAKNCRKVDFFEGHFSGQGKEKGVDVHLAVDMALKACLKEYDEALIMTGDADLIYPVEKVNFFNIPVHMIAISSRFPYAISFKTKQKIIYDYNNYYKFKTLPMLPKKPYNVKVIDLKGKIEIKRHKKPDA